jgi:hypothetical protein
MKSLGLDQWRLHSHEVAKPVFLQNFNLEADSASFSTD